MTIELYFDVVLTVILLLVIARQERVVCKMSQLDTDIKAVSDNEAALEARVTAHENNLKQSVADLQAQIDELKKNGATAEELKGLEDLAAKMAAFDPDATP